MRKFIIKRILVSALILLLVSFLIYALMRALPTSYIQRIARDRAAGDPSGPTAAEWLVRLEELYNLNVNIFQGFLAWLWQAVRGRFGESWYYGGLVTDTFADVIWYSVALGGITFVVQIIISVPLGILAARKQYSKTDYSVTVFSMMFISLPGFFLATLLKYIFAVQLDWFELSGLVSRYHNQLDPFRQFLDMAHHLVLPATTLILTSIGSLTRYTRTNMLEVLNADYIRTARAKGLSETKVINKHAFRNTLIPLVTILGNSLPGLFAGAMITEQIFAIPGIGKTSFDAMVNGDIPFSMFYLTFMAVLTLLGTLLADIMYAVVDPRIRVS